MTQRSREIENPSVHRRAAADRSPPPDREIRGVSRARM